MTVRVRADQGLVPGKKALGKFSAERLRFLTGQSAFEEKFHTIPNGKGIAYTIPMTSIIGKSIFNFLSDNRDVVRRNEK